MSKNNTKKDIALPATRSKAEQKLAEKPAKKSPESRGVVELVHELHVHKVQLEMQNDELIKTQKKLIQSNIKYASLFDFAPISYFVIDMNGKILNVNIEACKQIGIQKSHLKGKAFSVFISNSLCQDDFYLASNRALETEHSQSLECQIKRKNGSLFSALLEISMIKDENGEFQHFLLILTDISIQKEQKKNC